jgi:hypothetical protein
MRPAARLVPGERRASGDSAVGAIGQVNVSLFEARAVAMLLAVNVKKAAAILRITWDGA